MVPADSAESQFLGCCSLSTFHRRFTTFLDAFADFFLLFSSAAGFLWFSSVGSFVLFFVLDTAVHCFVMAFPVPSNFNGQKLYPGGCKVNGIDYCPSNNFSNPQGASTRPAGRIRPSALFLPSGSAGLLSPRQGVVTLIQS